MLGYEKLLALGGDLYGKMKARRTRYRSFFDHLSNARIEMLRAFRSLVDAGIAAIEKRKSREEDEKRATRIEVE